jgi:hypothetical protein
MPNEIPKHLRPTVTVTPTMREAARRAGIDVSRDDVVLRWRHERVCRLRALRNMCREIVAARAPTPLVETPVNVGDDETRDDGDDVDHDEDAPQRMYPRGASEAWFDADELPDWLTVKRREVMRWMR